MDGIGVETTFSPRTEDIDFLTLQINKESKSKGIAEEAFQFAIFLRKAGDDAIVGGCNGSIVYGSVYTDQLWVHPTLRGKGWGRRLMEAVHELGRNNNCTMATVGTMSFQDALSFCMGMGYLVEFQREG